MQRDEILQELLAAEDANCFPCGRKTVHLTEHKKHYRTLSSPRFGGLRVVLSAISWPSDCPPAAVPVGRSISSAEEQLRRQLPRKLQQSGLFCPRKEPARLSGDFGLRSSAQAGSQPWCSGGLMRWALRPRRRCPALENTPGCSRRQLAPPSPLPHRLRDKRPCGGISDNGLPEVQESGWR